MFVLKKILSALILPPLGPLLAIILGLLLWRRLPRLGRWLAWCGTLALISLSMPLVGHMLLASTEGAPPLYPPLARQAQAIVVLGGGTDYSAPEYGGDTVGRYALERLRYAARLARQLKLPLLVSGGAPFGGTAEALLMKEVLENDFGVAVRWTESSSADTHDNALNSASILHKAGIRRVVLVTHASHMRRAQAEFAQAGLDGTPYPRRPASPLWRRNPGMTCCPALVDWRTAARHCTNGWAGGSSSCAQFHFQNICDFVDFALPCYPHCLRLVFASPMIWKWNELITCR